MDEFAMNKIFENDIEKEGKRNIWEIDQKNLELKRWMN